MKNSINLRFGVIVGMITVAALSRFLFLTPSLANFSPVGAMALFGGAYFATNVGRMLFLCWHCGFQTWC
jgi:hypothetical protein